MGGQHNEGGSYLYSMILGRGKRRREKEEGDWTLKQKSISFRRNYVRRSLKIGKKRGTPKACRKRGKGPGRKGRQNPESHFDGRRRDLVSQRTVGKRPAIGETERKGEIDGGSF